MSSIKRFEDIIAWQKSRELTKLIYFYSGNNLFGKDIELRDQIRRSSISVMLNIAEGFDRGGRKEFQYYLVFAEGSCAEVRSQLYIAFDAGYILNEEFQELILIAENVSRYISALKFTVKKKRHRIRILRKRRGLR